jgi:hypothetical protein
LFGLAFKLAGAKSTSLRALMGARVKTDMGEDAADAADAAAQAFCTTVASFRSKLGAAEETTVPFAGVVVVAVVGATARCTLVATTTELNSELNNLITKEKRFYLEKILLNRYVNSVLGAKTTIISK